MNNFYSLKSIVGYSQVDANCNYRLDAIVGDFQQVTAYHSKEMGVDGLTTAQKSNAFWVLSKMKLKFLSQPKLYDQLTVTTFPTTYSQIRFFRDYTLTCNGEIAVNGTSEWCTLDLDSKGIRKTSTICYPFDMPHKTSESNLTFTKRKEQVLEQDFSHGHQIMLIDIDSNGHTNNVSYAKMALNCFTPSEYANISVDEFEIFFLSQSYYGDQIKVYKKPTDYGYYIEGQKDGKGVFACTFTLKR